MRRNLGMAERFIRIGLGGILFAVAGFAEFPAWGTILAVIIAVIAVVTGAIGFCPAWRVLGINTCESKEAKET